MFSWIILLTYEMVMTGPRECKIVYERLWMLWSLRKNLQDRCVGSLNDARSPALAPVDYSSSPGFNGPLNENIHIIYIFFSFFVFAPHRAPRSRMNEPFCAAPRLTSLNVEPIENANWSFCPAHPFFKLEKIIFSHYISNWWIFFRTQNTIFYLATKFDNITIKNIILVKSLIIIMIF